ncbi:MAG: hypothetical protein ACM31C_31925 [Acidobacteriota bacterium]
MRWWLSVCLFAACGGGHGGTTIDAPPPDIAIDAVDFGAPSTTYPAFAIQRPEITKGNGPVMTSVKVVPIYYQDDAEATTITDLVTKLAASSEWSAMVNEYGVGALTVATPVTLSAATPTTLADADLRAILTTGLDGSHPEYGPTDATSLQKTVFLFHTTAATTSATGPDGQPSCTGEVGYHYHFTLPSTAAVIYAIAYDCPPPPFLATPFDQTTATIGHELVEAATDPLVNQRSAYAFPNRPATPFALVVGNELADMCELVSTTWYVPGDVGYTIARSWSNSSAKPGHEPCLPIPPGQGSYFVAIPNAQDTVNYGTGTNALHMPGVLVQQGQPRTIDVDFVSDGPTSGDWTIDEIDQTLDGGGPALQVAFDRTTGQNGNKVHATITATRVPSDGTAFLKIRSVLGSEKHAWWTAVGITP